MTPSLLKNNATLKFLRHGFLGSLVLFSLILLQMGCEPPFEGVTAILTNNQVDRVITVQIVDADPNAVNPYPANVRVQISGDAFDDGLVYYSDGAALGSTIELVENVVNLAIKPNIEIPAGEFLSFTIVAEADGYLSNAIEVQMGANEKILFADLGLVNLSTLPDGVVVKNDTNTDFENNAPSNDIVIPVEDVENTEGNDLKARLTFKSGTVFKDVNGAELEGSELTTEITYFNGLVDAAVLSATGGRGNIKLEDGTVAVINGLVNVKAFLNGAKVKTFTNPVNIDIFLDAGAFNPVTNNVYAAGDRLSIISRDSPGQPFKNEGEVTAVIDEATQRLKVRYDAVHFSDYSAGSVAPPNTVADDGSNSVVDENELSGSNYTFQIRYVINRQLIAAGEVNGLTVQSVLNKITIPELSAEIVLEVFLNGFLVVDKTFNAGDVIAVVDADIREDSNPLDVLNFNLETQCSDGIFRYTGPIQYRPQGSTKWLNFSNSVDGLLSTQLLEWGLTYDFRVTYKGQSFVRVREVIQSHFRENAEGTYDYWGPDANNRKTFFTAPIGCGSD